MSIYYVCDRCGAHLTSRNRVPMKADLRLMAISKNITLPDELPFDFCWPCFLLIMRSATDVDYSYLINEM